jgi:hypothetical protein
MKALDTRWLLVAWSVVSLGCAAQGGDDPEPGSLPGGGATGSGGTPAGSGGTTASGSGGTPSGSGGTTAAGGTPSSGGSTSSGGTTAAGGTPSSGDCPAIDANDVISNFEGGVAHVEAVLGRDGSWFQLTDGSGTLTPEKVAMTPLACEAGGACASAFAYHTTGTGFSGWGAGAGTDFAPKTGEARTAYDVSGYTGIALRAKAASAVTLRVSVSDKNTAEEGGVCTVTEDKTDETRCEDYFGKEILLGTDWQDYAVLFAEMTQRGFGLPATAFEATQAYTLRVVVKGDAAAPVSFDVWIDDVRFTH